MKAQITILNPYENKSNTLKLEKLAALKDIFS